MILYILNSFFILFLSFKLIRGENSLSERILKIFTVCILTIISIEIILGVFINKLSRDYITLISSILFLIGIFIKNNTGKPKFQKFDIEQKYILIISIIGIALTAKFFFANFLKPYCYDSTTYHLPNLVDYIQSERIFVTEKVIWSNAYPKNIELLNLWSLIFNNDGFGLKIPQYFISLFGGIAVYGILKELKINRNLSFFGGLLFLATPIVIAQLSSTYIDSVLSAIFIITLYFGVKSTKYQKIEDMIFLSLCMGILAGIKYSAIGYVAICFFVICVLNRFKYFYLISSITIFVGGFWYFYNFYNFHNPIYPFGVKVLGKVVFEGVDVGKTIMIGNTPRLLQDKIPLIQTLISWIGIDFYTPWKSLLTIYDQDIGGFGIGFVTILLPSFIFLMYSKLKSRNFSREEIFIICVLMGSFVITPSNWWSRYTIFIVFLGIYSILSLYQNSKWLKTFNWLCLFTSIGILQGSLFDVYQSSCVVYNYYKNDRIYPINSYINQTPYFIPYYKDLMPLLKVINNSTKGFTIDTFDVPVYSYYLQGDRLQNSLKCYFVNGDKYLELNNIDNYNTFEKRIIDNNSDFVIVSKQLENYMKEFINKNKSYKKITDDNDYFIGFEKER